MRKCITNANKIKIQFYLTFNIFPIVHFFTHFCYFVNYSGWSMGYMELLDDLFPLV